MKLAAIAFICVFLIIGCTVDGDRGPAGAPAGNVPGGMVAVCINDGSAAADLAVMIAFDPDEIIGNGNETLVEIPLAAYIDGSTNIRKTLTWQADTVAPGSYYVYAWLDVNGNRSFDTGVLYEWNYIQIYDEAGAYAYQTGAPYATITSTFPLVPNYICTADSAADIVFEWYIDV